MKRKNAGDFVFLDFVQENIRLQYCLVQTHEVRFQKWENLHS